MEFETFMTTNLKLAWRNIWRNKRRTLITVASIFFGVLFSAYMTSMQEGSYGQMVEIVVKFYSGYMQIHQEDYWENKNINNSFDYDQDLVDLFHIAIHFFGGLPINRIGPARIENDLKPPLVGMIPDPKRRGLKRFIVHKTQFSACIDHKTDIQGTLPFFYASRRLFAGARPSPLYT